MFCEFFHEPHKRNYQNKKKKLKLNHDKKRADVDENQKSASTRHLFSCRVECFKGMEG